MGWQASNSDTIPKPRSMSSSDTSSSLGLAPVNEDELASLPITQRLERMTVLLFQTVNARDFDSPILSRYLSPTFRADDIDRFIPSSGCRHSYIDELRKASSDDQMYDHQITSTCAEVDEDQAVVWATLRTTISPYDNLVQETVSRLQWVFKGKRIGWVCTEHRGLRGGGELGALG
ncbi:hypothetical protein LTR35_005106 [Friedmanniomyces endolithicus]|uniref:Uncharacterized protein n=1 Tax=Friedmanniomyces endolithicus TaxID=329885 RepID=A0AAN6J6J4_9PEZI|nr:hypothetical protein LTR35_005106 [Friedmanniomyces endolithicus]KAK0319108.1 hypothetical protein LTR82_009872 [Friedmanniomyces endolithicus]KAK0985365.1 hypothetical protein LTR54_013760 [Friedmanniomyces endolithicus]